MGQAIRGLSTALHPYALDSGVPQNSDVVRGLLNGHFQSALLVVEQAKLPERCLKAVQKAQRTMETLVSKVALFHLTVRERVAAEAPGELAERVLKCLLPAAYLMLAAERASEAKARKEIKLVAQTLLTQWSNACLRTSSCVEGRNGVLSLHHHGAHNLTQDRLTALTTVHNHAHGPHHRRSTTYWSTSPGPV